MQFKSKKVFKIFFGLIISFLILPVSVIAYLTVLGIPIFFFCLGWKVREYSVA